MITLTKTHTNKTLSNQGIIILSTIQSDQKGQVVSHLRTQKLGKLVGGTKYQVHKTMKEASQTITKRVQKALKFYNKKFSA